MVSLRSIYEQLSKLWARRSTRPSQQSGSTTFVHSGNCCAAASKHVLHLGAPPVSQINQPFLLVVWDYSIRCHGCQESISVFFPKANITAPNTAKLCPEQNAPAAGAAGALSMNMRLFPAFKPSGGEQFSAGQPLVASMALTSASVQPVPVRSAFITGSAGTARYMLLP